MQAILRIGASNELIIYEDRKLYFVFSLRQGSILTDAYKHLANLDITELKVMITPVVKARDGVTKDYEISNFIIDGRARGCFVSKIDIDKIKDLASALRVNEFKVYNSFDVFKLIGTRQPTIICGKYVKDFIYYIFVDEEGIKDFRSSKEPTLEKLEELSSMYGVDNVLTERNSVLNGLVRSNFDNIMDMEDEELSQVYLAMCADIIKPCMKVLVNETVNIEEVDLDNDDFNEQFRTEMVEDFGDFSDEEFVEEDDIDFIPGDFDEEISLEDTLEEVEEVKEEEEDSEVESPKSRFRKGSSKNKTKEKPSRNKLISRILDIVGCLLVMLLALNIVANKEVPNDIEYLNEKIVQTETIVKPMRDNVSYMTKYVEALTDGKNTDNDIVKRISAIPVDGILAEVALEKRNVGVAVYLANEKDIDKFTEELNKIVKVDKAEKVTVLELDSDPLHKFVVSATIK